MHGAKLLNTFCTVVAKARGSEVAQSFPEFCIANSVFIRWEKLGVYIFGRGYSIDIWVIS